jgi:hypothetical protein
MAGTFLCSCKRIGDIEIGTYWFNTAVLWTVAVLLYLALYYKLLQSCSVISGGSGVLPDLRFHLREKEYILYRRLSVIAL